MHVRVFRGASPELVHTPLGCGFGFWVSKSDARYNCGLQFSFCRFTRMQFLPLFFQQRCLARFRSESLGGVSHSAGHSVVNRQNKKPIHRDIKNRREHCSRFKMMKLCIGSVNSETIYLLINQPRWQTIRYRLVRQCTTAAIF